MTNIKHNPRNQLLLFTLAYLCITTSSWAQSPEAISYQAVIRNAENALVVDKNVAIRISILQGDTNGTAVYVETHNAQSNNQGLVSIAIGSGNSVSGDFSDIDWSKGPYFIKTETDIEGGSNYSITGTSQLMTVPYAMHAKSVEGISATDIENLANLSGINTGDQDLSNLATQTALGDSMEHIRREIPDVGELATNRALTTGLDTKVDVEKGKNLMPDGTSPGEMKYWNGTNWIAISAGSEGQVLTYTGGVPTWITTVLLNEVQNPATGRIWMDRNLGASQVATSSTDASAYGDLYQWGRGTDGHQVRTSGTTTTLSTTDIPGHGDFILTASISWHSPHNDSLWQGTNGTNDPCPSGYRVPTEAEWEAERASWSSNNATGAIASLLRLPVAGYRDPLSGSLIDVSSLGYYWTSTVDGIASHMLSVSDSNAAMLSYHRATGFSVRCIKD